VGVNIPKTMITRSRLIIILLIVIFALFISPVTVESSEKATHTIRIGTVDVNAVKQTMKFQPTADYIAAKISNETTQYKGEVIIPSTVNNMINQLKEQRIDLYFESPFTIALVDKESGQYHSY
jgi:hypothetical protein